MLPIYTTTTVLIDQCVRSRHLNIKLPAKWLLVVNVVIYLNVLSMLWNINEYQLMGAPCLQMRVSSTHRVALDHSSLF